MFEFKQSQAAGAETRVYLILVDATDGITRETGEATGQPVISKNGGAITGNTTNTLVHLGRGIYYVELTATELDTIGTVVVSYKSAATAEASAIGRVKAYDPYRLDKTGYALTAGERSLIAQQVFKEDLFGLTGEAAKSFLKVIRGPAPLNKWRVNGTNVETYKEDDATLDRSIPLGTTAGVNPVTQMGTFA